MKKTLLVLVLVGLMAAPALAGPINRANSPIYSATPSALDSAPRADFTGVAYSNMTLGNNYAVTINPGYAAEDDYTSIVPTGDTLTLSSFRFVGGVTAVGGVIWFDFFDSVGTFVNEFGVQFSSAGNYIWTITLNTPGLIANGGFMDLVADDGVYTSLTPTTAKWYLNRFGPTIGTTLATPPGITDPSTGQYMQYKFELSGIPEPATLALLGLGVVGLIRRR